LIASASCSLERNPIQLDRTPLWKSLRDRIFDGEPESTSPEML